MIIPQPITLNTRDADIEQQIQQRVPRAGVYLLALEGTPPHISWSRHLQRRLVRLLVPSYPLSGTAASKVRSRVSAVKCWPTASRLETSLLLYYLTKAEGRPDYLEKLRLRMPWFVSMLSHDPFPRLTVSNRLASDASCSFGPFRTRDAAQRYEQEMLGLFQLRRCTEKLEPYPAHPGCIYGEMNLCLRPCQEVVSDREYMTEVERAQEFLATNGDGTLRTLSSAREHACSEMEYEVAAQVHRRVEKVTAARAAGDAVLQAAASFCGVAVTASPHELEVYLWPLVNGYWQQPAAVSFRPEPGESASLDRVLRERLSDKLRSPDTSGERLEEMAVFARWYYSSWRDGDWFPFRTANDLNYRQMVRRISALLKNNSSEAN